MFLVRNYFFSTLPRYREGSVERQDAFSFVKKVTKDLQEMTRLSTLPPPPFDRIRCDHVRSEAVRISRDPVLMKQILSKTKFCLNKKCNANPACGFAHSMEEYNPPTCLQREFCTDDSCTKNHVFTKAEYMDYYDVQVPSPDLGLKFTQFCQLMKEHKPCNMKTCTFAHSLWEYRPLVCKFEHCVDDGCIRFHKDDTIFSYMEKQGIKFHPWMLRSTDVNNHLELEKRTQRGFELDQAVFEDIREMEARNWFEDNEDICDDICEDNYDDDDEEDDDEEEDEPNFTIFGKKTFTMSEYLFEQEMNDYGGSDDDSDDELFGDDNEEELMCCATELGLDFDLVYDMIENDKQHVIFMWYKNFKNL